MSRGKANIVMITGGVVNRSMGDKAPPTRLAENYASYLLRFRRIQNEDKLTWVATVQSTATGEQAVFLSVDALVEFLLAEFSEGNRPTGSDHPPPGSPTRL